MKYLHEVLKKLSYEELLLLGCKYMNDEESSWMLLVRWPAKRAERFGFALNFFALLFSFKRKKEKTYNRRTN